VLTLSPSLGSGGSHIESKDLLLALLGAAILVPQARSQNITFNQADRLNPYYPYNMTKADLGCKHVAVAQSRR
jgi:hypothetical protein